MKVSEALAGLTKDECQQEKLKYLRGQDAYVEELMRNFRAIKAQAPNLKIMIKNFNEKFGPKAVISILMILTILAKKGVNLNQIFSQFTTEFMEIEMHKWSAAGAADFIRPTLNWVDMHAKTFNVFYLHFLLHEIGEGVVYGVIVLTLLLHAEKTG